MTRTTSMKWYPFRVFAILALASAPGFANPILVNNFSFESLPSGGLNLPGLCGPGCAFTNGTVAGSAIPGWVGTGTQFGQFHPGNLAFPSLPTPTIAYTQANSAISQIVGVTVQAGMTYTLMVDIGMRLDNPFGASVTDTFGGLADLKISNGTVSGTTQIFATGLRPLAGTFSTYTAIYEAQAGDVGKTITIELSSLHVQGDFDNVRLDAVTPEPASFLLIGSALLALTSIGRRRKKS